MDSVNRNRNNRYDRVMSRVLNQSRSSLKSSSFVTRHDMPSSVRVGAKQSVSNVSSRVLSELPTFLNDYVPLPESSRETVRRTKVVKPRKTIKSLDPEQSPPRPVTNPRLLGKKSPNIRVQESAPSVLVSNGEKWSCTHLRECQSSRSHSRLKELKDEIQAYKETEKLMRLRSNLYKKCGVVLDDVGNVAADKAVQVETSGDTGQLETRRKKWLEVIGRPDLLTSNPQCHFVCSLHFDKSMIKNVPLLKANAVPTKLLPNRPSTSKTLNDSKYKDTSTQTEESTNVNGPEEPSTSNTLNSTEYKEMSTQTEESITIKTESNNGENETTQTSFLYQALSSNEPRKRELHSECKESEQ